MFQKYRLFFYIVILLTTAFLLWFYSAVVIYILIAAVLSIIGNPIVSFLDKKLKFPHLLSTILTTLVIISFFLAIFLLFIPLFIKEAHMISNLNFKVIGENFDNQLNDLKDLLVQYGIMNENESIEAHLKERLLSVINIATFSGVMKHILGATGKFFIGFFAVIFITFFMLKNRKMLPEAIMTIVNEKYHEKTIVVMHQCKRLLSRYFIGLFADIILMITLITTSMTIFGIHNALLIGFFAGIAVIIPYIGPMIGASLAVIIGVTSALSFDINIAVLPLVIKILVIYFAININDGLVFQPLIYGKSVKASPLEIFLILLISGTTAGFVGMMVAIPTYTFIRIVAKEFLSKFRVVKKLTENL